jgi:hypothetical protein
MPPKPIRKNNPPPTLECGRTQKFIPLDEWQHICELPEFVERHIKENPNLIEFGIDEAHNLCYIIHKK